MYSYQSINCSHVSQQFSLDICVRDAAGESAETTLQYAPRSTHQIEMWKAINYGGGITSAIYKMFFEAMPPKNISINAIG